MHSEKRVFTCIFQMAILSFLFGSRAPAPQAEPPKEGGDIGEKSCAEEPGSDVQMQQLEMAAGASRRRRLMFSAVLFGLMTALLVMWFMNQRKVLMEHNERRKKHIEETQAAQEDGDKKRQKGPAPTDQELLDIAAKLVRQGWKLIGQSSCHYTRLQLQTFGDATKPARRLIDDVYTECAKGQEFTQCPGIPAFPTWRLGKQILVGAHTTLDDLKKIVEAGDKINAEAEAEEEEEEDEPARPAPAPRKKLERDERRVEIIEEKEGAPDTEPEKPVRAPKSKKKTEPEPKAAESDDETITQETETETEGDDFAKSVEDAILGETETEAETSSETKAEAEPQEKKPVKKTTRKTRAKKSDTSDSSSAK